MTQSDGFRASLPVSQPILNDNAARSLSVFDSIARSIEQNMVVQPLSALLDRARTSFSHVGIRVVRFDVIPAEEVALEMDFGVRTDRVSVSGVRTTLADILANLENCDVLIIPEATQYLGSSVFVCVAEAAKMLELITLAPYRDPSSSAPETDFAVLADLNIFAVPLHGFRMEAQLSLLIHRRHALRLLSLAGQLLLEKTEEQQRSAAVLVRDFNRASTKLDAELLWARTARSDIQRLRSKFNGWRKLVSVPLNATLLEPFTTAAALVNQSKPSDLEQRRHGEYVILRFKPEFSSKLHAALAEGCQILCSELRGRLTAKLHELGDEFERGFPEYRDKFAALDDRVLARLDISASNFRLSYSKTYPRRAIFLSALYRARGLVQLGVFIFLALVSTGTYLGSFWSGPSGTTQTNIQDQMPSLSLFNPYTLAAFFAIGVWLLYRSFRARHEQIELESRGSAQAALDRDFDSFCGEIVSLARNWMQTSLEDVLSGWERGLESWLAMDTHLLDLRESEISVRRGKLTNQIRSVDSLRSMADSHTQKLNIALTDVRQVQNVLDSQVLTLLRQMQDKASSLG